MKYKLLIIIFSILLSSCTYKKSIQKDISLDQAVKSSTTMLNKLNYNYSIMQTSNSNMKKIKFIKWFGGKGEIHLNNINDSKTKVDIISTVSDLETKILEKALTQEINSDFNLINKVRNKSYFLGYGLVLLNPGVGIFYGSHNNPTANSIGKWLSSIGYFGLDAYFIYDYLKNVNNNAVTAMLVERVLIILLQTAQIRNYNDIVRSGYDVYDIHYSFNPNRSKRDNYKLALLSKKI